MDQKSIFSPMYWTVLAMFRNCNRKRSSRDKFILNNLVFIRNRRMFTFNFLSNRWNFESEFVWLVFTKVSDLEKRLDASSLMPGF